MGATTAVGPGSGGSTASSGVGPGSGGSTTSSGTGPGSGGSTTSSGTGGGGKNLSPSDYLKTIQFDYQGENGVPYPAGMSLGYPAGVPNSYSWKFGTSGTSDVAAAISGRGPQMAGAAYDQVYQHRPGSPSAPNARVLLEHIRTYFFSKSQQAWQMVEDQSVSGAAFAEDFVNNQSTGADARDESNGNISVRSGTNASGSAGGTTGRTVEDGPVDFNYHGFDKRFTVDWADVEAILVTQVMSCIPDSGTDTSDCAKIPYLANVGLDSWASVTSSFDGFKTHGGVSGGRFKPVTLARQIFTNYSGVLALLQSHPPPQPGDI